MKIVLLAILSFFAICTGCTINIFSNGKNAHFELSPARNSGQSPTLSVLGGFSLGTLNTRSDSHLK